jgi:hypothetical protein
MIVRFAVCLAVCLSGAVFSASAASDLVCLPSAPSAQAGSSVTLTAWYDAAGSAAPKFKWSVTEGRVRSDKGVTLWDLGTAHPGTAYADVEAIVNGAKAASCSVELHIEGKQPDRTRSTPDAPIPLPAPPPPTAGPVVATSRAFLPAGQVEPEGFGLYSYILIGAPPAPADRDRYAAIFEATLRLMRPVDQLARALKTSQLNATWLPVKSLPDSDPDAKWLVDNYDYAQGAVDLVRAGIRGNPTGIYIVSARTPLSRATPAPPFLVQDLSHVPAALASTWVALFINQAAQEHFWNTNTMDGMVAKMRLAIALTAEGVPAIKTAMATWISISK